MTDINEAKKYLRYDLQKEKYVVDFGMRSQLRLLLDDYIESETNFDVQKDKLSKHTILQVFQEAVLEAADDSHGVDDPSFEEFFQEEKAKALRETIGREIETYTIVFPLNIRSQQNLPDSFSMPGAEFERISDDEWTESYEQPALEADETSLAAFLDESPNNMHESDGVGGVFTFWKTEYDARDHHYALSRIPEIVRLLLGKFNFVMYKWTAGVPQPTKNTRPPNARWSQLKEPFVYLVFNDEEYLSYWPYDYDLRRKSEGGRRDAEKRIKNFNELPDLPADREDLEDVDEFLANALLAYQDGITDSSIHQSFFAFWRGLENLAQVKKGEGDEAVIDRAIFALENVTEKEMVRTELQEAIEEIYHKRNELVHQGPHTGISQHHRAAAKILLDALLELYFSYYGEEHSTDDFRLFLNYGTKSPQDRKKISDVLDEIQQFED